MIRSGKGEGQQEGKERMNHKRTCDEGSEVCRRQTRVAT